MTKHEPKQEHSNLKKLSFEQLSLIRNEKNTHRDTKTHRNKDTHTHAEKTHTQRDTRTHAPNPSPTPGEARRYETQRHNP